ncbi:hypothetical protein KKG82_04655 [Patescibacteria group bacterium]|nr:hypothetical protein [Patescibacteria group bacterium]
MSEDQKLTKHVGEQKPLSQDPKPADNSSQGDNGNSGNPIKPQETQKGLRPKK